MSPHVRKSLYMSISVETLVKSLTEGEVSFKYNKVDGSTREARGTINQNLIPEAKRAPVNTDGPTVAYYDLDANDWRSFNKANIITG